jgi:hypothetical protein
MLIFNFMLRITQFILLFSVALLIFSCSSSVELTSSWVNKNAHVKKSPKIMVLALGKNAANRGAAENFIVAEMQKGGHNAIASLDILKPDVKHYDSLTMVNLLRQNGIDMLLTNAVIDVKETQRYVPGTTESVPVGSAPVQTYSGFYGGYYNYYDTRATYYETIYETRTTPGYTVTDVTVLIESNLYDVLTTELLWVGQSKTYTKEPSAELFNDFAKVVVADLAKNNLLQK